MSRTPIEPLRWWVQKVLPTVYDDSLSFQELLGKVVNKLNEVIVNVDEFEQEVDNKLAEYEAQLANYMTEAEVQALIDELEIRIGNQLDIAFSQIDRLNEDKVDKRSAESGDVSPYLYGYGQNKTQFGIKAQSTPEPGAVVVRDLAGRARVEGPENDKDIANKKYVDDNVAEIDHDLDVMSQQVANNAQLIFNLEGVVATKVGRDGTVANAEQLVSTVYTTNKEPYLFRTAGGSVDIGDRENDTIVGGTVCWNQLVKSTDILCEIIPDGHYFKIGRAHV